MRGEPLKDDGLLERGNRGVKKETYPVVHVSAMAYESLRT